MWASWLLAMSQSANTFLHLLWQITSFSIFNRLCLAQINFKSDFSQVLVWPSEPYTIWYWKILNSALSAVLEVIRSGNLSAEALHDCSSAGQLHVCFFFDCQPIGPCLVCFVFILKGDRSGETAWRISGPWIWKTTSRWRKGKSAQSNVLRKDQQSRMRSMAHADLGVRILLGLFSLAWPRQWFLLQPILPHVNSRCFDLAPQKF